MKYGQKRDFFDKTLNLPMPQRVKYPFGNLNDTGNVFFGSKYIRVHISHKSLNCFMAEIGPKSIPC